MSPTKKAAPKKTAPQTKKQPADKKTTSTKAVKPTKAAGSKAKATSSSDRSQDSGKFYYLFTGKKADGGIQQIDLLGCKGAGLAEMTNAGIPVPPGFTISTEVCGLYYENSLCIPEQIDRQLEEYIGKLEKAAGKGFGDPANPLLVSVRSGSRVSIPGLMDTILNLGLNDETMNGLAEKTGNHRFALDSYRRFISMFGNYVLGIDNEVFEKVITKVKADRRIKQDSSLQENDLRTIIKKHKSIIKRKTGEAFPEEPMTQLRMARDAVFRSWNSPKAISFRRTHKIPADFDTAVVVQAMVFGNLNNSSGAGVGFTRDPGTGDAELYGEYLLNAQGVDVGLGNRKPQPLSQLSQEMPKVYKKLKQIAASLEKHYSDVQDFEFTVENGDLYMLQTGTGKRTIHAGIKIAVDMVKEKLISKEEAILRISPHELDLLLHPSLDSKAKYNVVANGLPASPGAACGIVYFSAEALLAAGPKKKCILVGEETCPDDNEAMNVAVGILTSRGGMTSYAAVAARGMGKCCVSGAEDIRVNTKKKQFQIGKLIIKEGETITLNGSVGEVIMGKVAIVDPELSGEFSEFMSWADEIRRLRVRTNADMPKDAVQAIKFGAEGIGLCRTEHMFFAEDRVPIVQEMILADSEEERQAALDKLLPFQKADFIGIFDAMKGLPVTIRTLDPPLHEFLPHRDEIEAKLAELDKKDDEYEEKLEHLQKIIQRIEELTETNPMLGHRGCRLGVMFPEITEMQTRAIIEAACTQIKHKKKVNPEIMIPLVGHVNEFKHQKEVVNRIALEVMARHKVRKLNLKVGTMIEIPRAALTADEIAPEADFFSFGTNDLTQMTMGFSRDDASKFLSHYVKNEILPLDPFVSIDQSGVGQLIQMGYDKGIKSNQELVVGICGEHGGDPDSIDFCHRVGLDYVSCSPFRVPIARLAAAQATLRHSASKDTDKKVKA